MTPTLVVGAGGLIGRSVTRGIGDGARPAHVRWGTAACDGDLRRAVAALATETAVRRDGWRVVWCAGRSTIPDPTTAEDETAALAVTLEAVADLLPGGPSGRVVLTSSAGGIHAGSTAPPFDETTPPAPRSAYGVEKLAQEAIVARAAASGGYDAVTVRLGPVYGPGQDPTKAQGLVSALCRAVLDRRPVRVFVPMDTRRPYLWVEDAARILTRVAAAPAGASGALRVLTVPAAPGVTVGQLIATVRRVTRRTPPVLLSPSPEAAVHAPDLRLATRHPEMTVVPDPVPLTVGIGRLWRAMLSVPPTFHGSRSRMEP